ncbi:MAG: molybdopterin-dependent oxidoreductase [Pseudomonadales bacterium]|nr:molybdopterin-dependent oxidoreductase [Pseudomonadales bacterium]
MSNDMTTNVRTVCDPNCHANPKCGIAASVHNGRIIAVAPADYPVPGYENRICMMGRARLEYQYHAERLRKPLKRIGARGAGQWQEISWQEAIALFVEKQKEITEKYGSRAVLFHQISGAYGLLTRGSPLRYAALTGASAVRASGIDYGIARGLQYAFGVDAATFFKSGGHSLNDAVNSELTIIWGGNPAVTRSVDHVALKKARKAGTHLVCIDPVKSETAGISDEWISIRPGSDGALALAMANQIIEQKLYDESFLLEYSNMPFLVNVETGRLLKEPASELAFCGPYQLQDGSQARVTTVFNLVADMVSEFDASSAEKITGVDAATLVTLARRYAHASPAAIRIGYGVDRWYNADLTARSISMLACLCGHIGIPGGGVSLVSGGRRVPVKGARFYAPERKSPNFLSMMEADQAVTEGTPHTIKMECISLGNPYNQVKPNRNKVLTDYIQKLEFIAVIDHFMTDTAKWADIVLPAASIFERTDIIVDEFIQLQQPVVDPEGEAKSDFEIFRALAEAFGIGDYFHKSAEEYIDDMLDTDSPVLEAVNMARLKVEKVIYPWPAQAPYVGFEDKVFPTDSGRIEIYKEDLIELDRELPFYREPIEASPLNPLFKQFPLVLLSSHSRYRIHSTFANLDLVKTREPEPVVRVHPADAHEREIEEGQLVEVFNARGRVKIRCCVDGSMRKGCVLIREGHWIDQFIEGDPYGLTHDQYSPTTENYAHYDVLVEMKGTAENT